MIVNRIGVGSIARVAACLYGGLGLIIGICLFLFSLLGAGLSGDAQTDGMPAWIAPVFGTGAVVILPILYGVMGAVGVSIGASLYNVAARLVGGVQFEVDR